MTQMTPLASVCFGVLVASTHAYAQPGRTTSNTAGERVRSHHWGGRKAALLRGLVVASLLTLPAVGATASPARVGRSVSGAQAAGWWHGNGQSRGVDSVKSGNRGPVKRGHYRGAKPPISKHPGPGRSVAPRSPATAAQHKAGLQQLFGRPVQQQVLTLCEITAAGYICRNAGYAVGGVLGRMGCSKEVCELAGRFSGAYLAPEVVKLLERYKLPGTDGPVKIPRWQKAASSAVAGFSGSRTGRPLGKWIEGL